MFGFNGRARPSAEEGIRIIVELLSEEQTELLTLKMGKRVITPEKQLKALYGSMYCLARDLDEFEAKAASLINKQLLDFKKLAQRNELLEEQAKLDSYYQNTNREEQGRKGVGIKGSSNGGSNVINMIATKNREGQAAYSKEFPIEELWDQQNFEQLQFAAMLENKHEEAKSWELEEKQEGTDPNLTKYIAKEKEAPKKQEETPKTLEITQPPADLEDADNDMRVHLNAININTQSNLSYTKNNSFSEMGRRVESNKISKSTTQQFTKARAIRELQEAEEAPIRERIFGRFAVLFTSVPCL